MKGPSLHYDMRVLREFRCDACGRTVQAPAWATSRTCTCSDPPKFMRPLERPKTVSPDVSRFITPLDPEDAIEEEDVDEVPYVPHVPIKPPPPARFANRRKLYDDTAVVSEPDFGEGVSADAGEESAVNEDVADEFKPETPSNRPNDAPENRGSELRRPRGRQRGRGGSNDGDRSGETQRPSQAQRSSHSERSADRTRGSASPGNSDTSRLPDSNRTPGSERPPRKERPPRTDRPPRNDRQGNNSSNRNQRGNRRPNDSNGPAAPSETRNVPQSSEDVRSNGSNSDNDHDVIFPNDATSEGADSAADPATPQGEGRPRRSRRRGRRSGPRPEGGVK